VRLEVVGGRFDAADDFIVEHLHRLDETIQAVKRRAPGGAAPGKP